ncbi:MAG: signal recognition particle receptor subunit alpha, partial [Pseudomonadota bacterium]
MFDSLSDRLSGVFDKLRGRGALSEKDVGDAMREVRVALLEADVALPVAKDFVAKVKERAVGQEVLRSVTPGQQVVKIVHDVLVDILGGSDGAHEINLAKAPPAAMLMVGLQGSGKTTSTAKIALRLQTKERKKVLMASLDTRRPAAMEQLRVLGTQAEVPTLPIIDGQTPLQIANRAMEAGRLGGYDVVMLDTAGRLSIDEQLMDEVSQIYSATNPAETLLVLDSLTGQDAVQTAERFKARVDISGVVLTRLDGDGRGGAGGGGEGPVHSVQGAAAGGGAGPRPRGPVRGAGGAGRGAGPGEGTVPRGREGAAGGPGGLRRLRSAPARDPLRPPRGPAPPRGALGGGEGGLPFAARRRRVRLADPPGRRLPLLPRQHRPPGAPPGGRRAAPRRSPRDPSPPRPGAGRGHLPVRPRRRRPGPRRLSPRPGALPGGRGPARRRRRRCRGVELRQPRRRPHPRQTGRLRARRALPAPGARRPPRPRRHRRRGHRPHRAGDQ